MNFKLKKIHLFVILLIALIGCCIQIPQFNFGFNLGFKEGNANQGDNEGESNEKQDDVGDKGPAFQTGSKMNPLVLFNTMVNGASFSSIDETGAPVGTGTEADTGAETEVESEDADAGAETEADAGTTSSFENQKKNKNPLSSFLANIFGGKKEGMENEDKPAYPGKEGEEDQWILKSKIVPPVCPKCPEPSCDTKKDCPPCPSCARCPEPAFECKKVPNYRSTNDNYLPRPVLADFSQFGM